jgi:hypothetical protein
MDTFIKVFIDENKKRKTKVELYSLTLLQLISFIREAKIYPFDNDDTNGLYGSMLDVTCDIRNLLHPGRKIKAKFPKNTEQEYLFLESIYF